LTVQVHMKLLKEFAIEKAPKGSALRDVLLAEADVLTAEEYLAKIPTWLVLAQRDSVAEDR
jgi:hypothetical protein